MFRKRTVYAVACDNRGCDTTFHFVDDEGDGQEHELHLLEPELSPADQKWLASEGWQSFSGDAAARTGRLPLLCPPCARARTAAVFARLEIDLTHTPLPLDEEAQR